MHQLISNTEDWTMEKDLSKKKSCKLSRPLFILLVKNEGSKSLSSVFTET